MQERIRLQRKIIMLTEQINNVRINDTRYICIVGFIVLAI